MELKTEYLFISRVCLYIVVMKKNSNKDTPL